MLGAGPAPGMASLTSPPSDKRNAHRPSFRNACERRKRTVFSACLRNFTVCPPRKLRRVASARREHSHANRPCDHVNLSRLISFVPSFVMQLNTPPCTSSIVRHQNGTNDCSSAVRATSRYLLESVVPPFIAVGSAAATKEG